MANEICNDKSEDGSGTAGPEIISKKVNFTCIFLFFVQQIYDKG